MLRWAPRLAPQLSFVPPTAPAPTLSQVAALKDFISGADGALLAITGAGCSTESGIPDYRSPEGSYSKGHKPMTHQEFMQHPRKRARYWARSLRGWKAFAAAGPNDCHESLARLERGGMLSQVITQNVDGLHQQAGTRKVLDLHGRNDEVECLMCGARQTRLKYQQEVEQVNREWMSEFLPADWEEQDIRADGDAHLKQEDFSGFVVPGCSACGHDIIMPRIVFFGGTLRQEVKDAAAQAVEDASRVLVVGSSCRVFSAFNLVRTAARAGKPVAIVNVGETRADDLAQLRFSLRCGEILPAVCTEMDL